MGDSDSGISSVSSGRTTSSVCGDDRSTSGSRSSAASLSLSEVSSPTPSSSSSSSSSSQQHQVSFPYENQRENCSTNFSLVLLLPLVPLTGLGASENLAWSPNCWWWSTGATCSVSSASFANDDTSWTSLSAIVITRVAPFAAAYVSARSVGQAANTWWSEVRRRQACSVSLL